MQFSPQRYKIADEIGRPFLDEGEIENFLTLRPSTLDVEMVLARSLNKQRLSLSQVAVLLNAPDREPIMRAAERLKTEVYGRRIVLFAPLYVGNFCSNSCSYCSFRADNHFAVRKTLNTDELRLQTEALVDQGHKRLILVWGEHPIYNASAIARSVRTVYENKNIRRVNINAAPLSVEDFATVKAAGIGTYQVFQETYDRHIYAFHHPRGLKSDYDWRLTALDRAMQAGIDDVGLGALFGLSSDWRAEVMGLVRHTNHLEACFNVGPHTISFPRITKAEGADPQGQFPVADDDFLFIVAVLRLAVPYAGLILTAREGAELRDKAIRYGVSQIDGGTKIEIGGYKTDADSKAPAETGEAQFTINDARSLGEVVTSLVQGGRIPSFCTACYRTGRTGEHFMEFSCSGFIKRFCTPNAILTFAEYLEDYATPSLKKEGYELIERELAALEKRDEVLAKLDLVKKGRRDLYF